MVCNQKLRGNYESSSPFCFSKDFVNRDCVLGFCLVILSLMHISDLNRIVIFGRNCKCWLGLNHDISIPDFTVLACDLTWPHRKMISELLLLNPGIVNSQVNEISKGDHSDQLKGEIRSGVNQQGANKYNEHQCANDKRQRIFFQIMTGIDNLNREKM